MKLETLAVDTTMVTVGVMALLQSSVKLRVEMPKGNFSIKY